MTLLPRTETPEAEIRDLLLDGHTVAEVVRQTGALRHRVDRIANAMRAEGVTVMRAVQGRRRN
jgi:DNA invertase Pin-like site-specific DNA recombinase